MIQDNNIESLQDAIKQYQENQDRHFLFPNDKSAFKAGATWQAEQYKDLIQSHAELLDKLKVAYDFMTDDVPDELLEKYDCHNVQLIFNSVIETIEKANSIINK